MGVHAAYAAFGQSWRSGRHWGQSLHGWHWSQRLISAKQIIDHLPDQANWDDIMYELYVKQKIEKGLDAIEQGKTVSHEEARQRLLNDNN